MSVDFRYQQWRPERGDRQSAATLPRGVYRCRILDQKWEADGYSRTVLRVVFEVQGEPHAGTKFQESFRQSYVTQVGLGSPGDLEWAVSIFVRRRDDGSTTNGISRVEPFAQASEQHATVSALAVASDGHADARSDGASERVNDDVLDRCSTGFWIQKSCAGNRNVCDWLTCFAHACSGVNAPPPETPFFLSMFAFTDELRAYVGERGGSMARYEGLTYSPLLWFDVDRGDGGPGSTVPADIDGALNDTRKLVTAILELGIPGDRVLVFFSGRRGFHVGIPTSFFGAPPSVDFAKVAGVVCGTIAGGVGCKIDTCIYTTVHPLRAPNSYHAESKLHKVRLSIDELFQTSPAAITELAKRPRLFELPELRGEPIPELAAAWVAAAGVSATKHVTRRAGVGSSDASLFRATMEFLAVGAPEGERANAGFKAGMNLLDHGDIELLVAALLMHGFEKSGYPPSEAAQQIAGVLRHWRGQFTGPAQVTS